MDKLTVVATHSEFRVSARPVNRPVIGLADVEFDSVVGSVPFRLALIVVLALVLNWIMRRSIRGFVRRLSASAVPGSSSDPARASVRTETIASVLRSTVSALIVTIAVLMMLSEAGLNLGPLIASAGVAGVALGFGAQSVVRDTLAGMFVLIEDQYSVGDVVDVGPAVGTVERITLRATVLRDEAGTVWHVPNGEIRRAGNKSQRWSRAVIDVPVEGDTDLAKAMTQLERVADEIHADERFSGWLLERPRVLGVQGFQGGGATMRMVVDTEPASQWEVERQLRLMIKSAFDAHGIRLATLPMPAVPPKPPMP